MVTHANEGRGSVSQSIYNLDERLSEKFKVLTTYQDMVLYADRKGKRHQYHDRYWELEEDGEEWTQEELNELNAHLDTEYEPMTDDDEDEYA
jgi:hypothetical protein